MSEEMAVNEAATSEDPKVSSDEAMAPNATDAAQGAPKQPIELPDQTTEETAPPTDEVKETSEDVKEVEQTKRGIKRRASSVLSDRDEEEFKGFEHVDDNNCSATYKSVLEDIESEISAVLENFSPLRNVTAVIATVRANKRAKEDTDGSRPSSALSSRSDFDGITSSMDPASAASSPAARGRRATVEISSPLLRIPLERGWKRELVYRAALDVHSRRNADIYYYTPNGKKLRSTREVAEHLSGTGLTLENFSFFKEPLGVDDPEKEVIRDAKLIRRVESPVSSSAAPLVEGKRTPKPKPPKGTSPEPSTPKSPLLKIKVSMGKVKSVGSRLGGGAQPAPAGTPQSTPTNKTKKQQPTPNADNNNTAAWKKPRQPAVSPATSTPAALPAQPPPPLQSRPLVQQTSPDVQPTRQLVQPCSMACGRGAVPSLACAVCLCLYHPACVGHNGHPATFYCKNCRKSSPPLDPPPLTHKSGVTVNTSSLPAPVPRRVPVPVPVPVPKTPVPPSKRVLLRMKVAGGGPDGERVWAVAKPTPAPSGRALALRPTLPQSLAVLNGRRFIIVPRSAPHTQHNHDETKRRGRVANGASVPGSPAQPVSSPRRRGRPRTDDTDHFTAFYNTANENNYNVVVQIFQYLGMRDLAHCARVCKLWQQLAATPALWRHVRMKNSHVSDWGGLCSALKRHGTKRLDLRKMLLPQNDTVFWEQFAEHIATVDTLERIEMCRCPARAVEAVCSGLSKLRALSALAIRDALLDPAPLGALPLLHELRLKSMAGLSLTRDLRPLAALHHLQHLSLTSIKELGWCACDVVGQLSQLESLELGECTFRAEFALVLAKLTRLRRLRLERGTAQCAAPALLRALATLPLLTRLELVNFDVKVGFDDALAECKNIQRLLIIPTYVSQSATTNKQVLSGVLRLKDTLTHLMWGVTIELLRVTELFIDQCEQGADTKKRDIGECIPVLKPVPGCKLPDEHHHVAGPPQVEILPLPTLQRLLSAQLPNTILKLLRIPFHATWRQSLADFQ